MKTLETLKEDDKAKEHLTWAVEHMMKELQAQGWWKGGQEYIKNDWLSPEMIGSAYEALAFFYQKVKEYRYFNFG